MVHMFAEALSNCYKEIWTFLIKNTERSQLNNFHSWANYGVNSSFTKSVLDYEDIPNKVSWWDLSEETLEKNKVMKLILHSYDEGNTSADVKNPL